MKTKQSHQIKEFLFRQLIEGNLSANQVAAELGLSRRQVVRIKNTAVHFGGIPPHSNSGRKPVNCIDKSLQDEILEIRNKPAYSNTNFTFFHEILLKTGIQISLPTLRKILLSAGIKSPKKHRHGKAHKRRIRREQAGELLQGDASKHQWFILLGDSEYYNIHALIDDATGKITGIFMTKNECISGYFGALEQTLKQFGKPSALYLDGLNTFFPKRGEVDLSMDELHAGFNPKQTQFGRVMSELGIEMIHARSSQAKGRIERLWGTLQGRLPTLFAEKNIRTIEEANIFLAGFRSAFNAKYSVQPLSEKSAFIPMYPKFDYDHTLCVRTARMIDQGMCFSMNGITFQILDMIGNIGKRAYILISPKFGVIVELEGKRYKVKPIISKKQSIPEDRSSIKAIISRFVYEYSLKDERKSR
jgi:transposase